MDNLEVVPSPEMVLPNTAYETAIRRVANPLFMEMVHTLHWPSLTVEWFPDFVADGEQEDKFSFHRLIMGTHTGEPQDHLLIAGVSLHKSFTGDDDMSSSDDEEEEDLDGSNNPFKSDLILLQKINHEGAVNRARHMPRNPCLIATKTPSSDVLVFNYMIQPNFPDPSGVCNPELRLKGHEKGGFGLSWNMIFEGKLLSASADQTVCMWDINATPGGNRVINAHSIFRGHTNTVADVAWHPQLVHLFGTVGFDEKWMMWDSRCSPKSILSIRAHSAGVTCIDFHPCHDYRLVTGSADKTVGLWDLRMPSLKVHSLGPGCHTAAVSQVHWSPHCKEVLASSDIDGGIYIWNIDKIGTIPEEDRDAPPEFVDCHSGPWQKVNDFSWNPNTPSVICQVSEENIVEVFHSYSLKQYVSARYGYNPCVNFLDLLNSGSTISENSVPSNNIQHNPISSTAHQF
ncbi:histone-binding protein RBBP4-like [Sitophilus oryzae]|uniref:Histone-binding protein RBBP4-like n=1 Tax=Sitophilus oryzae TaxID=7048 RepID=A0A6J2Y714_SITOR|nr:histone-binding protein RBBP4-like [Sitophilus oryzae]